MLRAQVARLGLGGQEAASCSCSYASVPLRVARTSRAPAHTTTRLPLVVTRSSSQEEMFDNLFNSEVFRSELVMKEFTKIVQEATTLSSMASKFPDFDLQGKQIYLTQMQEMSDRYEIFIKRLELSQDPAAREYLRSTNAQMLEGGFTLNQMFVGIKQSVQEYRKWVEQEERVSNDPVAHQQFLQSFRESWGMSGLGRLDLSYLVRTTDPQIIMKAQQDPKFWVMLREVSTSPTPEVMAKWMDDPNIGPLVGELWKSMQGRSK